MAIPRIELGTRTFSACRSTSELNRLTDSLGLEPRKDFHPTPVFEAGCFPFAYYPERKAWDSNPQAVRLNDQLLSKQRANHSRTFLDTWL